MQHPVLLDEATATRLGYGSTCILAPAKAVMAARDKETDIEGNHEGGNDDSDDGRGGERTSGNEIPEMGGTFRMWSNYRIALEGDARNVQAGTLLAPALDAATTVADSFRRRWAAGGQYPELTLARVRLTERGPNDGPPRPPSWAYDRNEQSAAAATKPIVASPEADNEAGLITPAPGSPTGQQGTARKWGWRKAVRRKNFHSLDKGRESETTRKKDNLSTESSSGDEHGDERSRDDSGDDVGRNALVGSPGGLRQVLPRLDGLDSGTLVERALEDLQDEEKLHARMSPSSGQPDGMHAAGDGLTRRHSLHSDRRGSEAEGSAMGVAAAALGVSPAAAADIVDSGSLAATLSTSKRHDSSAATASASTEDAEDTGAAVVGVSARVNDAASAPSETGALRVAPSAEKFMLPEWHHLALSGRSISMDFRWSNMDLILMQDPTARQGRDTGKNVLALRSSGGLTVRSSGTGESIDAQLEDASLLPCFYAEGGGVSGEDGEDVFAAPQTCNTTKGAAERAARIRRRTSGEQHATDVGAPRRLALLLGGDYSAWSAVARTWLGQGLITADARPLLEPFTVQMGYGTVVVQAGARGRRGDGALIPDERKILDADDSTVAISADQAESGHDDSDDEVDHTAGGPEDSRVDDHVGSGETVAGVFRVAISELRLLVAQAKLKGAATVEVEVSRAGVVPGSCSSSTAPKSVLFVQSHLLSV